jgi:predicted metalloprotease with PDZ domain
MLPFLLLAALQAPDTVRYEVAFPDAAHHEAAVSVTFPVRARDTLEVWMSRSSPGRYALHEFAKNVYGVTAVDGRGRPLRVVQRDPYKWRIGGHDGTVTFRYTLFGDRADGTYAQVDRSHAHLNMPATFAWARGLERRPIAVRFEPPAGSRWRVATQLVPTRDSLAFAAPDLQYFMDSPTELSDFTLRSWTVDGPGGRRDTVRLALHHLGTDAEADAYAEQAKKVVAEHVAVYGETARYDHGTYTFIADYLPWASGDGMEHRNSTIISSSGDLAHNTPGLLNTLSHEFFHSWNIERIRPRMLEPFDFTRANPSDALWFGEGFTSYFDALAIRRAGLSTDSVYASALGRSVNAVVQAPGRRFFSPMEMSLQAPFVDAAASIDPQNRSNTFLSYYTWGAGVGLGLDLTIRGRFPGKSLDGFMRTMWERFGRGGRYQVPRPYTVADLERTLGEYVGDPAFSRDFFARYIRGREVVDYAALLGQAGIVLRRADTSSAWAGPAQFTYESAGATLQAPPLFGSPLYATGIGSGDRLVSVGGKPIMTEADWRAVAGAHRPGDSVAVVFEGHGERRTVNMALAGNPRLEAVPVETTGGTLSEAQRNFREAWLRSGVVR